MDRKLHQGHVTGPRRRTGLAMAILPAVMAITVTACGGGGGGAPVVKKQFIGVEDNVQDLQGEPAGLAELQMPSYALGLVNAGSSDGSGGYRGKGVRVAVIDSEFDVDHPDISAAFQRNTNGTSSAVMLPRGIMTSDLLSDVCLRHGLI